MGEEKKGPGRPKVGPGAKKALGVCIPLAAIAIPYLVFAEPLLTAAFASLPLIASGGAQGLSTWLAWVSSYATTAVVNLDAFAAMDWASLPAVPGYALLLAVALAVTKPVWRPGPPRNDIIDSQPGWSGTNEEGNTLWLRRPKEICEALGFDRVPFSRLEQDAHGIYMGEFGSDVLVSPEDEHVLILAPTRVGKTRRVLLKQIATLGASGESIVAFDPKGELYGQTSPFLRDHGYFVNRIDFSDAMRSNRWNPLSPAIDAYDRANAALKDVEALERAVANAERAGDRARRAEKEAKLKEASLALDAALDEADKALKLVCSLVFPRSDDEGNAKFFNDGAENLIMMTFHYLCGSKAAPREAKTIFTAHRLINEHVKAEKLTKAPGDDRTFVPLVEEVHKAGPRSRAYQYMLSVDNVKQIGEFRSTASGALATYASTTVARMMTETDLPLAEAADRKTATFIIVPSQDETFNAVARLYINQLYSILLTRAQALGGRLPVRINILGEEFKQLPRFDSVDNKLSICAGYGVRWILVLQSLTQLEDEYGRSTAATILENLRIQMYLQAGTAETGEYIAKRCGTYTIKVTSSSSSKASGALVEDRFNQSESIKRRARCSADEAMQWDPDQGAIVTKIGHGPSCIPVPKLEQSPFNAYLDLGDPEYNQEKSRSARAEPAHAEPAELPDWNIDLDDPKKASRKHSPEERVRMLAEYRARLLRHCKARVLGGGEPDGEPPQGKPRPPARPGPEAGERGAGKDGRAGSIDLERTM